ncbi:Protein of unknown function DUF58 [Arboricoccus pini]|uniref:DUF58 domain-containing protein n=1 Tax=Arboricoccus pini TaxID=1963835 RepID=A0A212R121_9PROT|nr:DUF58 domain-containing protein [Arboricoccus pini]SNB65516.1 Protein of unknown function DUF58 [Arboricoccus pini]
MSPRTTPALVAYRPPHGLTGLRIGAHAGRRQDGQAYFRDLVPFERDPDGRRIDLRASARDPLGRLFVRRLEPRNIITVNIVVDMSGSMGFEGNASRQAIVRDAVQCLIASARAYRDPVGLTLCDGRKSAATPSLRATLRRTVSAEAEALLAAVPPTGGDVVSLEALPSHIGNRPRLIFLLSDFLLPDEVLDRLLQGLSRHYLVALRIEDGSESGAMPRWGLVDLADLETGKRRLMFLRPALRRRWEQAMGELRLRQQRLFASHGRDLLRVVDRFDAEALARHLRSRA